MHITMPVINQNAEVQKPDPTLAVKNEEAFNYLLEFYIVSYFNPHKSIL
jgi:hypothetical protein